MAVGQAGRAGIGRFAVVAGAVAAMAAVAVGLIVDILRSTRVSLWSVQAER